MTIRTAALSLATCVVAFTFMGAAPATGPASAPAPSLKTDKERTGYAIGLQIGPNLKGVDYDEAALAAGIRAGATGSKPAMTDAEVEDTMKALQKAMMAKADAAGTDNQKVGDAFLAENAKKDGIKTTASGLQYKVITAGTGKSPKATDTVSVNYRGTLISGKEFDASQPGKPVSFPVDQVIPGWTEVLQLMKEGDKFQVFIPSKLAYAERGTPGGPIGPNEALIFEVELLKVNP